MNGLLCTHGELEELAILLGGGCRGWRGIIGGIPGGRRRTGGRAGAFGTGGRSSGASWSRSIRRAVAPSSSQISSGNSVTKGPGRVEMYGLLLPLF